MLSLCTTPDDPKDGDINGHVYWSVYWIPFGSSDVLIIDTINGIIIGSIIDPINGAIMESIIDLIYYPIY